jgi:cell division protein FtsB
MLSPDVTYSRPRHQYGLTRCIAAANHFGFPCCVKEQQMRAIDAVLPQIQAEREPEIIRAQQLQSQEAAQAELLRKNALLRWGASQLAPLLGKGVRHY